MSLYEKSSEFYTTKSSAFEPVKEIEDNELSQDFENISGSYISKTLPFSKSNRWGLSSREQSTIYYPKIDPSQSLLRDLDDKTPTDNILRRNTNIYPSIIKIRDIPDSREETDYWAYYSNIKSYSTFHKLQKPFHLRDFEGFMQRSYERIREVYDIQIHFHKNEISRQFDIVKTWNDSWTDFGLERPSDLVIFHSENVIDTLLNSIITAGHEWLSPVISGDGDGNVSIIWYKQERELHLQIGENDIEYFKVWGANIDTEMEVDFLKNDLFPNLWKWLINE